MHLGAFSVSLSVKDLSVSRDFYQKLGFEVFAGDPAKNYLMMKSGDTVIGLFQGMFEGNILTFNPGWDQAAQPLDSFEDVRAIQGKLKEQGIAFETEADESSSGPGHAILVDPDGNTIFLDQHV